MSGTTHGISQAAAAASNHRSRRRNHKDHNKDNDDTNNNNNYSRSNSTSNKVFINFNFENCVSIAHEGLPGSPNRYRIRLRMDPGYKLTDLQCGWKLDTAGKRLLRLNAATKALVENAGVKANKSFEILVEPVCQAASDAQPSVTPQNNQEECWIEFPVAAELPSTLPLAKN